MIKKSVLLTALAIAGFAVTSLAQTVPNYVPSIGLFGWWPFNGNAIDESSNTNDGTVNGATLTADRFGIANSAYSFAGNQEGITINQNIFGASAGNFSYSISLWLLNDLNNNLTGEVINNRINAGGTNYNYRFGVNSISTQPTYRLLSYVNPNISQANSLSNIYVNQVWNHFVLVGDISQNQMRIYKDGILIATSSNILSPNLSNPTKIGYMSSLDQSFKGKIDDIGMWNRVLTPSEITGLYNGNVCFQTITVTDTLLINTNITGFNPVTYQNTIKIWPNPTNDHITIDNGNLANLTGHQIKISNALGQQVFQSAITQQQFYVDMSTWGGNGIYFVNLINAQGVTIETRKIVLQ